MTGAVPGGPGIIDGEGPMTPMPESNPRQSGDYTRFPGFSGETTTIGQAPATRHGCGFR